jgi:transposase
MFTYCEECFNKQREIDYLKEEIQMLKQRLRYKERKEQEGFLGSSTPSSKIPVKANTSEKQSKPKGAQQGHKGNGRKAITESDADCIETIESVAGDRCPNCGNPLAEKGIENRIVFDSRPLKMQRILYRLPKKYCAHCRKTFQPQAPGVLPRGLYGNQLIATVSAMHYLHGIPMGRICEQIGLGAGSLVEVFHNLARLFASVVQKLIEEYRISPVRHADETGWRINGKNGYVWLFATEKISIFLFRKSRSAKVPQSIFGDKQLSGVLVVDRYAAYNKTPCALQYCYAHLLRDVENLEKDFPESGEIKVFVSIMAPLLTTAMNLRSQPIPDEEYYAKAAGIKAQIIAAVEASAVHLGIQHIQNIFHENAHRLYHWVDNRRVPAENNLAERDLRPTVIARKVSFGSLSDAGAHTRSVLMTVLHSLKKQKVDIVQHLKNVLDQLSENTKLDPYSLLFPQNLSPPSTKR